MEGPDLPKCERGYPCNGVTDAGTRPMSLVGHGEQRREGGVCTCHIAVGCLPVAKAAVCKQYRCCNAGWYSLQPYTLHCRQLDRNTAKYIVQRWKMSATGCCVVLHGTT